MPVLDGVVCATKQAEVLVELGLKTSKRKTYRPPERKQAFLQGSSCGGPSLRLGYDIRFRDPP